MAVARLPGIFVDPTPAGEPEPLPRMDVALFAGFAATGPLGCPHVCESIAQYELAFGADDFVVGRVGDQVVRGGLGPSVRAFFRNGGRRCWVLRLAFPEVAVGTRTLRAADYVDQRLLTKTVSDLIAEAEYILYPRHHTPAPPSGGCAGFDPLLDGLHAALSVPEASMLCVPDAAFAGWEVSVDPASSDGPEFELLEMPPAAAAEQSAFRRCAAETLAQPAITGSAAPGGVRLHWTVNGTGPFNFVVEEARVRNFADPIAVYSGQQMSVRLRGLLPAEYFYRVRVQTPDKEDELSAVLQVQMPSGARTVLLPPASFDELREVHRHILRICAARGDLFGILALPRDYRETAAVDYAQQLTDAVRNGGEGRTLSYGALYHPWLVGREENRFDELTTASPDGAIAGVYAKRAWYRGAWVAPANEDLKGVVALEPEIAAESRLTFYERAINLIQQEPPEFVCMNEATLSTEIELRPVHIRRLLILLRRLAFREGAAYVFEPNSEIFRRGVQRGFERVLEDLFQRGAFAGRTPREAFQVVTGTEINTREVQDLGRLIVELKVAVAREMQFLTLRLVQTAERTLLTEGT